MCKHFKHTCTKTAFELKLWIFVVTVRIRGPRGDRPPQICTNLPRLLNTIPCQFLLGPSMHVGAALEPLDLRHYLNSSLLCMGAVGCDI